MISNCTHCGVNLTFSQGQRAKLQQAIASLKPGRKLTLKCPQCKKTFQLNVDDKAAPVGARTVIAPAPPDLDWLKNGRFEEEEKVEDVPMALILHPDPEARAMVKSAMESVGYLVLTAKSAAKAIEQMRSISFACVAFHVDFEGAGLANSIFHNYMRQMSMDRRRYIFYILIGPQFHSLYDLEALASSANMVVAEQDLQYFDIMLRKAISAYEELFGPILEELDAYGKR
jgi:CheY-like chemotaxis protein